MCALSNLNLSEPKCSHETFMAQPKHLSRTWGVDEKPNMMIPSARNFKIICLWDRTFSSCHPGVFFEVPFFVFG